MVNADNYKKIIAELENKAILVAVSKTKPVTDIKELYDLGQRDFGENYVQELADKQSQLPADIRWHYIGHLQSNKVKYIVPFVHLIHGVDSFKLLKEINKQSEKVNRVTDCLLQVYIAQEETKFGFDEKELEEAISQLAVLQSGNQQSVSDAMNNVRIIGLMGMASFTDDVNKIRNEFQYLKSLFDKFAIKNQQFSVLSMGMSADYKTAIAEHSTMVRIGSLLFGERDYNK